MNVTSISDKLKAGNFEFTTHNTYSNGFHGTFYAFKTMKIAVKAINHLRLPGSVQHHAEGFGFTIY